MGTTTKNAVGGEATVELQSTTTEGIAAVTATAANLTEGKVNVVIFSVSADSFFVLGS